MKNWLKNKIASIYDSLGWNARRRQSLLHTVLVLTYHGILPAEMIRGGEHLFEYRNVVTQEEFSRQMAYIVQYYTPIAAPMLEHLAPPPDGKPYAIITFDDGFENNYHYAYPVLKQYGIAGHFFLTTDFMGTRRLLWTEEVTYRIMNTRSPKITLTLEGNKSIEFSTHSIKAKEVASINLRKWLKLQRRSVIEKALSQLREQTGDVSTNDLPRERYQFMNWDQIREMQQGGMVFGSHTSHHFLLNNLTGDEVRETLQQSRQVIERELQQPCELFSYPNGEAQNFSPRDHQILQELNFRFAFTQIPGFNPIEELPKIRYQLYRINISYFMSMPIFKAVITGLWNR